MQQELCTKGGHRVHYKHHEISMPQYKRPVRRLPQCSSLCVAPHHMPRVRFVVKQATQLSAQRLSPWRCCCGIQFQPRTAYNLIRGTRLLFISQSKSTSQIVGIPSSYYPATSRCSATPSSSFTVHLAVKSKYLRGETNSTHTFSVMT